MRVRRTRRQRKRTYRKQKGGGEIPLPSADNLIIEVVYNDYLRGVYSRDTLDDMTKEDLEQLNSENRELLLRMHNFVKETGQIDGIEVVINDEMRPREYIAQIDAIKDEYNICNGKINKAKLYENFAYNGGPSVSALLRKRDNNDIIGVCQFSFTHISSAHKFGMRIDTTKLYIKIDWLCGSNYKGVGTILINLIKQMRPYLSIVAVYLISYDSAIPFYIKVGFKLVGMSNFGTPKMVLE